jgi:hypothetical protein
MKHRWTSGRAYDEHGQRMVGQTHRYTKPQAISKLEREGLPTPSQWLTTEQIAETNAGC